MRPPHFWQAGTRSLLPRLLAPLEQLTAALTAARLARGGWAAPLPVLCCGNVTSGGAGKTTLALDLAQRLCARGIAVHILSRGYGGAVRGIRRVHAEDTADQVGDEPLLLRAVAPTWVGADRAATARAAIAAGAEFLLMDDGLQNPSLQQTCSLLVIDGRTGFGNGRLLPAGPLREHPAIAAGRCQGAVIIGPDRTGAALALPPALPILRAHLTPGPRTRALAGRRVLAVAGIADPSKFFATLGDVGAILVHCTGFPDHHPYAEAQWRALIAKSQQESLTLVTTAKDAVRLPPSVAARVHVADVFLQWTDANALDALLDRALLPRE